MHEHYPDADRLGTTAEPAGVTTNPHQATNEGEHAEGSHSMWLMVLCCAPMVLIAIALLIGALAGR